MAFQINTNIPSLQAQEYLRISSDFQNKTINRVTSGLRIVSSGDDAAGLAIANGFRSDQAVLTQGIRNANDGLSTVQIIDGGINNIAKLLDRARTLATQSASGTFNGSRTVLNSEFQSLITEINRQAQSIGLDTGGQFAKSLSVFIGGGRANAGVSEIVNGSVSVDLSQSTIDGQSLGLSGVRAASVEGTDLSTSSATTSVEDIVADSTNTGSQAVAGLTDFYFRGAGFSDDNRVKVSANLSGVTNTSTLVAALNDAIEAAGNGTSASATAFKNANVKAVLVSDPQTDGSVKERIGFISSTGAFQVAAGDRLANALLGNFSSGATGASLTNTFIGGTATAAASTAFYGTSNVVVRIQSGGLAGPVDLTLNVTSATTIDDALTSLSSQVANNAALQAAGITLDTATAGSNLAFSSSRGERFDVSAAGDVGNLLGLGGYRLATATATGFDYTQVDGASGQFSINSSQTLEFSIAGGVKVSIAPTISGGATGTVNDAVAALNNAIAANSTLTSAGIVAEASGGQVRLRSTTGTAFRVNAVDAQAVAASTYVNPGSLTIVAATNDTLTINLTDTTGTTGVQTLTLAAGAYATNTALATQINTQIAGNGLLNGRVEAAVVNNRLVIRSTTAAGALGDNSITLGGTSISNAANIGITAGTYTDNVFGFDTSTVVGGAAAGNLVSALAGTLDGTYNIAASTNDVFSISVDGGSTVSVTLTAGAARTAAQVVADLNGDSNFAAVARAQVIGGKVTVSSINPDSTLTIVAANNDAYDALGFTAGANNLSDKATVNSGGAYNTALGANDDVFSYRQIRNGSDDQTINITAVDANGTEHSLSVILQNDATARTGATLDAALKAINTALQQSGDPVLKQVVAVKEQTYAEDGEGFRFLSTLKDFKISVGTTATSTASNEVGAFDATTGSTVLGQGVVKSSEQSDGGSQVDISTQSAAETAVTSLSEAVRTLGIAQATVGRGQNQFSFAVNLAQSQVANIAAAESRIRDADLAAEAANLTKAQIILQAGIAALAQANSAPQAVLALLRG